MEVPEVKTFRGPSATSPGRRMLAGTIHSSLRMNAGRKLHLLYDQQLAALRNKLSKVRLIIIDEVSMVSSVLFYPTNQQLNKLFGYSSNKPFAGFPFTSSKRPTSL